MQRDSARTSRLSARTAIAAGGVALWVCALLCIERPATGAVGRSRATVSERTEPSAGAAWRPAPAYGEARWPIERSTVDPVPDESTDDPAPTVEAEHGELRGEVAGAPEEPALGFVVALEQETGVQSRVAVRPDGSFAFAMLTPGTYEVWVTPMHRVRLRAVAQPDTVQEVTVRADETAVVDLVVDADETELEQLADAPRSVLRGRLLAADTDEPLQATVIVAPAREGRWAEAWTVRADATGAFELPDVPVGRVRLSVVDARSEDDVEYASEPTYLDVGEGGETSLPPLRLDPRPDPA